MNRDDLAIELGWAGLCKQGEPICGDFWCRRTEDNGKRILVLSDGMGSGVKANILATLTGRMLATMLAGELPLDECVMTVSETLPMCRERKLAYATFTAITLEGMDVRLSRYDNPPVLLLRQGKSIKLPTTVQFVGEKEISESRLTLEEGDLLLAMSDGIVQAGRGKTGDGWPPEEVAAMAEQYETVDLSPQRMAALILRAALALNLDEADDDATVLALKVRRRKAANVMIGRPENPENDNATMRLFFSKAGYHAVCGGSTSQAAAAYLGKELRVQENTATETVPALSRIEGVDLATEGMLTLEAALDLVRRYRKDCMFTLELEKGKDGASRLARLLLEQATDINFFFGTAVNPANLTRGASFQTKLELVKALEKELTELGKNVKLSMC